MSLVLSNYVGFQNIYKFSLIFNFFSLYDILKWFNICIHLCLEIRSDHNNQIACCLDGLGEMIISIYILLSHDCLSSFKMQVAWIFSWCVCFMSAADEFDAMLGFVVNYFNAQGFGYCYNLSFSSIIDLNITCWDRLIFP
jgi:hypothetical protein